MTEPLNTSASQHSMWEECPRKWWFSKVAKLPEPSKGFFTFGNVLHSVIERYLLADDLGRVPTPPISMAFDPHSYALSGQTPGAPVELYPPGWEWVKTRMKDATGTYHNTWDRIEPEQEALIQNLVDLAITEGHLARWPNREIEVRFGQTWKGDEPFHITTHMGRDVTLNGFIDLRLPGVIRDWKSKKNLRYTVSKKKMPRDIQLLQYAKVSREHWLAQGLDYPSVNVGHVTFSKDPNDPRIKPISVDIDTELIEQGWAETKVRAAKMVEHAALESHVQVPSVELGSRICGYCPYNAICLGTTSIPDYTSRVLAHEDHRLKILQQRSPQGDPTMGLLEDRAAGTTPAAAPAPAPAAGAGEVPLLERAPWARADCVACSGSGVSSVGDACMPCIGLNTKDGLLVKDGYYTATTDGTHVTITAEPAQAATLQGMGLPVSGRVAIPNPKPAAPAPTAAPAAPPAAATPAPAPAAPPATTAAPAAPAAPPATAPAPAAPAAPAGAPAAPAPAPAAPPASAPPAAGGPTDVTAEDVKTTRGKGRPAGGFTLILAGGPERGFTEKTTHHLDQVLHLYGQKLAAAAGVDNYYQLDPWKRRDAVAAQAAAFAEHFGKGFVFATPNMSPDLDAFIVAIRPLAKVVIGPAFAEHRIES